MEGTKVIIRKDGVEDKFTHLNSVEATKSYLREFYRNKGIVCYIGVLNDTVIVTLY